MRKLFWPTMAVLVLTLTGCSSYVANQVLGDSAIPVDVGKAKRLAAPGIYQVMPDGNFSGAYCIEDFEKQAALKPIKTAQDPASSDTLDDQLGTENITFGFPGIPTINVPYRKTRVTGYTVTRAEAPDTSNFYEFVRNGVGKKCRDYLDSGKFIVVEQEARAKKSFRLTKGPIDSLKVGPVTIGGTGKEIVTPAPSNVTFGIVGQTGASK
jgi:hypothetical protein